MGNCSDSGFINGDIFSNYMDYIRQLTHASVDKPIILLVDNHSSHYSTDVVKQCENNGIYIVFLPANSTHITQPLDVSVFKPLKSALAGTVSSLSLAFPDFNIATHTFSTVFTQAYTKAFTSSNIKAGFKSAGIFPFNSEAIPDTQLAPIIRTQTHIPSIPKHLSSILAVPIPPPKPVRKQYVKTPNILTQWSTVDLLEQKKAKQVYMPTQYFMQCALRIICIV
jgi:hypothetical protein